MQKDKIKTPSAIKLQRAEKPRYHLYLPLSHESGLTGYARKTINTLAL